MAPHVTTVLTAARTGARVVRYLIRPAQRLGPEVQQWGRDPWLPQSGLEHKVRRTAHLTRRGLGLATLLALSVFGSIIIGLAVLFSGIGLASGSTFAGWVLGFTLLLGLVGLIWTARRAFALLNARELPVQSSASPASPTTPGEDEASLLRLLHTNERALPPVAQQAFRATVLSTRDALRVSAGDGTLSREAFDARQAVREDLPELLEAYRAVPPSRQSDEQLLEQLALIEGRMQTVLGQRAGQQQRQWQANRRYLQDKYQQGDEEQTG